MQSKGKRTALIIMVLAVAAGVAVALLPEPTLVQTQVEQPLDGKNFTP